MFNVTVAVLSFAVLLAMVLNLALKPPFSTKLMTGAIIVSLFGGLVFYGVGFAEVTGSIPLSIIRTLFCVFKMFAGINDLGSIAGSTFVSTTAGLVVFWLLHLLAFYSMASAVMFTLGAEALRYLRMILSRKDDLVLVYGINENSRAVGRECFGKGNCSVIFVAEEVNRSVLEDINNQGMSVLTGTKAVAADLETLRKIHADKRRLTVYALDDNIDENLFYALRLRDSLAELGVPANRTYITLPGTEDIIAPMLQVSEEKYGFGYVSVFDAGDLSARALIRLCPPWDFVKFGSDGRAEDGFECAIVGFGSHGQAVLKQLVMNGQFAGSRFRAAVFSPSINDEAGYLVADSPELLRNYEILRISAGGQSSTFYEYVTERLATLKLIAVCTGDEERDLEIVSNLMLYLKRRGSEHICVVQCGDSGVRYQETVGSPIRRLNIYTLDFLSAEKADREAILLNSTYDTSDRTDWEKWVSCDIFGKMSSRASADFTPAFLKAAGKTREEVLAGDWALTPEQLEALGETEHLRWNAFHFANGYAAMSREEMEERVDAWKRAQEKGLPGNIRITRDAVARRHACLIPWNQLDELSRREHELTGRTVDYKQIDINNVLALPTLLRAGEEGK
ncbi:MAG: hypothetical protein IJH75_03205 [Mogibacterium sp.]|nr:hypothetical protein [Mogibacterium sp.]